MIKVCIDVFQDWFDVINCKEFIKVGYRCIGLEMNIYLRFLIKLIIYGIVYLILVKRILVDFLFFFLSLFSNFYRDRDYLLFYDFR